MARLRVLVHGGADAATQGRGAAEAAASAALRLLEGGAGPLEAAVEACRLLEDDGRFNAGRGRMLRIDGATRELDAACMTGDGKLGAAVGLRGFRNPILVARAIHGTPHHALAGPGLEAFAASLGLERMPPPGEDVLADWREMAEELAAGAPSSTGWTLQGLRKAWNYPTPMPPPSGGLGTAGAAAGVRAAAGGASAVAGCDTVGAVATDGRTFAAASSTGGLGVALQGRVSDVPLPGCGLHAGPDGAVVVTGHGEHMVRTMASLRVYERMAIVGVKDAVESVVRDAHGRAHIGVLAVGRDGGHAATNRSMPWAQAVA
ncbi:MAG TPA: isoaspartyl peptidase/L-asparaginase [Candidatus Thermoplasmatota archaeon]|nr:isoaspartyl peptidase/L-asparaginase [Candidatus Thermoplasmatota archaeon]